MKESIYFLNGKFISKEKALISVEDTGFQRGYGVFEVIRTYRSKPFCLKEHLDRLFNSAKLIKLKLPWSKKYLIQKIDLLIKKNKLPESIVKIIITGGQSKEWFIPTEPPSICILIGKFKPLPKAIYQKGISLITFPHLRYLAQAKSLNYTAAVIAQKQAERRGAFTALYVYQDKILECPTSNFFIVKNKIISTPKDNILFGITRKKVLEIARHLRHKVIERAIKFSEIKKIDEAFVTNSVVEIVPIVKIDKIKIGLGKPGPITKKLIQEYKKETTSNRFPYSGACPVVNRRLYFGE